MKASRLFLTGIERAGRTRDRRLEHANCYHAYAYSSSAEARNNRLQPMLEWLDRSFDTSLTVEERQHARSMVLLRCNGSKIAGVREHLEEKAKNDENHRNKKLNERESRQNAIRSRKLQSGNFMSNNNSGATPRRGRIIPEELRSRVRYMHAIERKTIKDIAEETGESRYYVELALKGSW